MDVQWGRPSCLWFILESSSGRCQHFDEYFSISRLPLSGLAFVLQLNPSEHDGILARHLPQVIIEVPVTQQPVRTTGHSAEEAVFRPRKQESAIKSYTPHNKSVVGDGEEAEALGDQLREIMRPGPPSLGPPCQLI